MMAGPFIDFTEVGRHRLAKYLGITHWICLIPSFICLIFALYIQLIIEDKISFIENYNGAILPGFLVFTGSFGFFSHMLCGKAIYSNRVLDKREKWAKYLLPVILLTFVIFILEITGSIICYVHISDLGESFDKGIRGVMLVYNTDIVKKEELDVLQMTYECCGSKSYSEWFSVSWTDPNTDRNNDVPFSCCNPSIKRPCIHHRIHDNRFHYNYDYRSQLTIHKRGCSTKLMEFYENSVLTLIGSVILSLSFIQLVSCIACRILQTAISEAMRSEDPEGPSQGYIFGKDKGKGLDDTQTTEETTELLDATGETIEITGETPLDDTFDDERYIDMDIRGEPVYENMKQPAEDEEHIYNEGDVEEYLAMKFAHSKEVFEPPPIPPPPVEEEPIYENEPLLREVKSNKGNFMTLNSSTNSFYKPLSAPTTTIHRHLYPSPIPRDSRSGYYVIDLDPDRDKTTSQDKTSPTFESKLSKMRMGTNTAKSQGLSSPNKSPPWTRPRFKTYKVQPQPRMRTSPPSIYYSSPKRSSPMYGSINTSRKRSSDRKSLSPIRAAKVPLLFAGGRSPSKRRSRSSSASPGRQTFKSGSSYGCHHGITD